MANRNILLCLLILCTSLYLTECGRYGGGSRSSSRGGSSWGKSWSSGSSGSRSKPSSSWHTGSSSSGSSYKPSSSSSGSSWWSSGSSGSSGSHGYPSSSSGLSGSGSRSHGYPSSSSGLSGSGSRSHGYPSSSSGLSGSGSNSHGYPSSSTGLSGSSSGSRYPSSSSGWSGSGSGTRYPSSGSGSHSYPSGTGLSGSGSGSNYRPTHTYNTNSGYGSGSSYHPGSYGHSFPTYYHYPQHVYVTEYRDSGSRYGDLLTGLTLYNMGRSHSYHNHYYYDDYYRTRYNSPSNSGYSQDRPSDEATCTLRIKENGKLELLKIPCEIVSTFTEGSKKVTTPTETHVNTTVCTTNTTVITKTAPGNVTVNTTTSTTVPAGNVTVLSESATNTNMTIASNITDPKSNLTLTNGSDTDMTTATNITDPKVVVAGKPIILVTNTTEGNTTTKTVRVINSTEEIVNVTVCTTTSLVGTDPLSVKGPPINPSAMECAVDIKTKDAFFRNNVDCSTLIKYAKMPPPKKESTLLPNREKLKTWLSKPPWWMSMFIAV